MIYVDPAWLQEEYATWHRSMTDIANEIGCERSALATFARTHGIALRIDGSPNDIINREALGDQPGRLRSRLAGALSW
ncbi:hypothetical protein [Micromonospora sp. NBC_01412]|uniref:hypothetical protein n=1 Tax=Micromonospora sp. NBC_01412 TaxID=2903590 RepID=UPI003248759B